MNFDKVWDTSTGNGVIVAVLDTGLKIEHQDFCEDGADACSWDSFANSNIVTPYDTVDNVATSYFQSEYPGEDYDGIDNEPDDISGHGTHVSGIIGALYNNKGTIGAAYGAQIMPIRVMYIYCCDSDGAITSGGLSLIHI